MQTANTITQPTGMIKAIIIDDEPLARQIVGEYLQFYPQIVIVQECSDGFEGIKAIQQHHPDLLFLDIQMPKINGFEMLELVEEPPAVIFTTAFDEYAIRAFENHAVDYLLKPFNRQRFDKAVQKWLDRHTTELAARAAAAQTAAPGASRTASGNSAPHPGAPSSTDAATSAGNNSAESITPAGAPSHPDAAASTRDSSPGSTAATGPSAASGSPDTAAARTSGDTSARDNTRALLDTAAHSPSQQQRVVVKTGGKIKIIPMEDIHYLEASDDYVKIHTHNGAFLKNKTMSYFEQVLDGAQFVRTHRSYIINVQQVTRIDPYEKDSHLCILQSGAQVPVSKSGYVKLKAVLGL